MRTVFAREACGGFVRGWLVLVLLLAPTAWAQENGEAVVVTVDPFVGLLEPGKSIATPFHARVACNARTASGVTLSFDVLVAPFWGSAGLSRGSASFGPDACTGSSVSFEGILTVRANQSAPAFQPALVVIIAYATGAGNFSLGSAQASAPVTVSYYSSLELTPHAAHKTATDNGVARFTVVVTNNGNAPTRVVWSLAQASVGLNVSLPDESVVPSRWDASSAQEAFAVVAQRQAGIAGPLNFTLVARGSHAEDDSLRGDEQSVTLTLDAPREKTAPAPAFAGALLALALVAFTLRRRRA